MKRQISIEEISDGRLYKANDLVKAGCHDCKDCSLCCEGMGESILLDPKDLYELTTYLGRSFEELLENNLELHVVDGLILPNLKMDPEKDCCSFLDENKRCSIHSVRPGFCRLFPLGRIYEQDDFHYFLQVHECPMEHKTKVKVKKWLGIEAIASYEEFIRSWHMLQKKTQEIMEQKKDDSLTKKINLFVLQEFYVNPYEKDDDFYSQYARREQNVLTVLEGIANS